VEAAAALLVDRLLFFCGCVREARWG
jgi:hypothetical protein